MRNSRPRGFRNANAQHTGRVVDIITRLEEVILLSVWRLQDNAYGVTINKEVSKAAGKKYSMGALYFSLDQLYRKGLVEKSTGDPTPARGGRRKIYYRLTSKGKKALQAAKQHQETLWEGVSGFVFDPR